MDMYDHISQMEPLYPARTDALEDLAREVVASSAKHEALGSFLHRFALFYDPAKQHGVRPLIALAAAHHRLMWIHPFLDGNGRVARLFTDAYFLRSSVTGYGLWNVSRGLARQRDSY